MSANYPEPAPEPDTAKPQQPLEPAWERNNLPIDPQQPLREYTSSMWNNPGGPPAPYTSPQAYQPARPYQPPPIWSPHPAQPGGVWPPYPPAAGYPPYAANPGYPAPGIPVYSYPGQGYYVWHPVAPGPKRDTYLLVVGILAFICSCLVILGGLACLAIAVLGTVHPNVALPASQYFSGIILYLALGFAGAIGGSICLYHCMRSLFFKKRSRNLWFPHFWIFVLGYLLVLGVGFLLHIQGEDVAIPLFTGLLIYLAAIFPALAILALGIRRLSSSKSGNSPTSWRRFTLALVSGSTLSISLALILELLFTALLVLSQRSNIMQYLNNPNAGNPDPSTYLPLLILLSVIAPLVEETVKPLAVILLIGRVRSKAEAFALGLACGIGFNLVETTGYISSGYRDWLSVALLRSGAGLLHGFGAAMVALGWYCLTHKEEGSGWRRTLLWLGCGLYAVLQHAIWNGSWTLMLLPGPLGNFFQNWNATLGPLTLSASDLVNIVEAVGILVFFFYMAGRLRSQPTSPPEQLPGVSPNSAQQMAGAYLAPRMQ